MIIRTSTVLSVASLIAAFAGPPVAAGEWATKEDAIAMVQRARVFITQQETYCERLDDIVVCGSVYNF